MGDVITGTRAYPPRSGGRLGEQSKKGAELLCERKEESLALGNATLSKIESRWNHKPGPLDVLMPIVKQIVMKTMECENENWQTSTRSKEEDLMIQPGIS